MSPELYLAFTIATAIALVVPGPTILLVISYALARGRTVTLALVSGVVLGDLIAMSVTLAGPGEGYAHRNQIAKNNAAYKRQRDRSATRQRIGYHQKDCGPRHNKCNGCGDGKG